jgi:hypothetical protein
MIGRNQGVEINHLPGRLVAPRHLHSRGSRTDRSFRCQLLRKLLEQTRSRHRRFSTSNAMTGNQIAAVTATGKNSHTLSRNQARLGTSQHGLGLLKRHTDLFELVITLIKAGNHVLAEHGVIIGDDPELDLNSHGLSQGSMADKLQPTCLPQRRPRHPTDFYALVEKQVTTGLCAATCAWQRTGCAL